MYSWRSDYHCKIIRSPSYYPVHTVEAFIRINWYKEWTNKPPAFCVSLSVCLFPFHGFYFLVNTAAYIDHNATQSLTVWSKIQMSYGSY